MKARALIESGRVCICLRLPPTKRTFAAIAVAKATAASARGGCVACDEVMLASEAMKSLLVRHAKRKPWRVIQGFEGRIRWRQQQTSHDG